MKALNYWQQFTETGKLEDYLFFKEKESKMQENETGRAEEYAGDGKSDRNGIEDGAYRGFR